MLAIEYSVSLLNVPTGTVRNMVECIQQTKERSGTNMSLLLKVSMENDICVRSVSSHRWKVKWSHWIRELYGPYVVMQLDGQLKLPLVCSFSATSTAVFCSTLSRTTARLHASCFHQSVRHANLNVIGLLMVRLISVVFLLLEHHIIQNLVRFLSDSS